MSATTQPSVAPILRLTSIFTGALFALAGAEEFLRTDPASSNTAGFIFVLIATFLFGAARAARVTTRVERLLLAGVQGANPVLARAIQIRAGQLGLSLFITGVISSISSAAILKANVYSLVLFAGMPILLVGLVWMISLVLLAAVATFRDARAGQGFTRR